MRKIKFRHFDPNEMSMTKFEDIRLLPSDKKFMHIFERDIDGGVLMQYSEINDKNDTEIYEGDILNGGGSILYIVYFENGSFVGKVAGLFRGNKVEWDAGYHLRDFEMSGISVIGNIYENSNLI